jgi:hypothetical protein
MSKPSSLPLEDTDVWPYIKRPKFMTNGNRLEYICQSNVNTKKLEALASWSYVNIPITLTRILEFISL